jgi:cytochrome P450
VLPAGVPVTTRSKGWNVDAELLDQYPSPRASKCPFDPPPLLTELRDEGKIVRVRSVDGFNPWLITSYQEGRDALTTDAMSADPTKPGWSEKSDAFRATLGGDKNLRTMDNPEHAHQKRMLVQEFTVKRLSALQPAIKQIVDGNLDRLEAGPRPVDLIKNYTMQVPIVVICELLGVPYEDSAFFAERSEKAIGDSTYEEAAQAGADLKEYVIELVSRREREPDGGLISRIISQHVKPGNMTTQELIDTVRLLIIAGFETTMNQLGLSTLVLLCNPEVLAEVRDSEDEDVVNDRSPGPSARRGARCRDRRPADPCRRADHRRRQHRGPRPVGLPPSGRRGHPPSQREGARCLRLRHPPVPGPAPEPDGVALRDPRPAAPVPDPAAGRALRSAEVQGGLHRLWCGRAAGRMVTGPAGRRRL